MELRFGMVNNDCRLGTARIARDSPVNVPVSDSLGGVNKVTRASLSVGGPVSRAGVLS